MSDPKYPESDHSVVETTVAAIISRTRENETQILLTRRGFPPYQDHWCLPGGHIDRYEPAQQAVIREVKEEVGLDFNPDFLFYWDEIIPEMDIHAVVLVFSGNAKGDLSPQPGEVVELEWFSFNQIEKTSLAFQHNGILNRYRMKNSG